MALTRAKLKAFGIEDEKIEEIISDHIDTVNALKDERDAFKETAAKYDSAKKELDELREKDGKNPWKVKYDALKEDFDSYKSEAEAAKAHESKSAAYRKLLAGEGIADKYLDRIIKVSDVDSIELDADGNISDVKKHKDYIKSEWSDFIKTTIVKNADVDNPPHTGSSKPAMSKSEILAIKDTAERRKKMAEYGELFNLRVNESE